MSNPRLADAPQTRSSLAEDLRALGLPPGETVLLHASLSALGWVAGGPVAVIQALLDALGPHGTLMMPTFTENLTDPSHWRAPPVAEQWWSVIRAELPAFDPAITPTQWMGTVAETFRSWPGARRSRHPHVSFTALGPNAEVLTADHQLVHGLDEGSPLARLYELNGLVLLLGVEKNSSLHLAEHRSGTRGWAQQGAPIVEDGVRVWKTFMDLAYDDASFPPVKAAFEASGAVQVGRVGRATAKLMRQRELVDFAVRRFRAD